VRPIYTLAVLLLAVGCASSGDSEDELPEPGPRTMQPSTTRPSTTQPSTTQPSTAGAASVESQPKLLWYGALDTCALKESQLEAGGQQQPTVLLETAETNAALDVALDAQGRLWMVGSGSARLYRFDDPAAASTHEPNLIVASAALRQPGNLALDANGGLWVANRRELSSSEDGTILRFDVPPDASGKITLEPSAEIASAKRGDLFQLGYLKFDGEEHLWVTSFRGLLRFDDPLGVVGQMSPEPDALIEKSGFSNNIFFYSVAFDAEGSLWAASADGLHYLTSITKFENPNGLTGRGSPRVAASLLGARDELPAGGLTLDDHGNLWLATASALVMYRDVAKFEGMVDPPADRRIQLDGRAAPTTNSHLVFHRREH
jgi:ligand-binding sensor domain-containing protein